MNHPEAFIRVLMIGTAALAVVGSVLAVALQLWLKRQSPATQERVQARMTRFTDQSLRVLNGTAHAYAVVAVASLALGLVGAVLLIGLMLVR